MTKYEKIKLIVLDTDGTLTNGGIYYDSLGNEMKTFNVKDGLALKVVHKSGLPVAIMTGRKSAMVQRRAEELQVQYLVMDVQQKYPVLLELSEKLGITLGEIFYIGDDWNDLQCISKCGLSACPRDAAEEVRLQCDYIANCAGGEGAVRECLEWFMKLRGTWEKIAESLYFV